MKNGKNEKMKNGNNEKNEKMVKMEKYKKVKIMLSERRHFVLSATALVMGESLTPVRNCAGYGMKEKRGLQGVLP